MPHYTVRRDDSELRVVICPACSTNEVGCSDITLYDEVIPYKAEGYLLRLMRCNKCETYFSFYTEDGLTEISEYVAKNGLEKGRCDMLSDGHDNHSHSYYIIFKSRPFTISREEYETLRWAEDGSFKKWIDILPSVNFLINNRCILNNIDFEKMESRYLKPASNRWFK